jgi:hypothetical protein
MGKRRAKKSALAVVARLIESYRDVGQPFDECNEATNAHDWVPADGDVLDAAFQEIQDELNRRAQG